MYLLQYELSYLELEMKGDGDEKIKDDEEEVRWGLDTGGCFFSFCALGFEMIGREVVK